MGLNPAHHSLCVQAAATILAHVAPLGGTSGRALRGGLHTPAPAGSSTSRACTSNCCWPTQPGNHSAAARQQAATLNALHSSSRHTCGSQPPSSPSPAAGWRASLPHSCPPAACRCPRACLPPVSSASSGVSSLPPPLLQCARHAPSPTRSQPNTQTPAGCSLSQTLAQTPVVDSQHQPSLTAGEMNAAEVTL